MITYPFTEAQTLAAYESHGANCGPVALAFACRISPEAACEAIPGFAEKGFTSPMMMRDALANLGRCYEVIPVEKWGITFAPEIALVRVQFSGPWTLPGVSRRWAYKYTHWICAWEDDRGLMVFDINGGIMAFERWVAEIIPLLAGNIARADGRHFVTHIWRLSDV